MKNFSSFVFLFVLIIGTGSLSAGEITRFYVSDKLSQSSLVLDNSGNLVGRERLSSFGGIEQSSRGDEEWKHSYHGKQRHTSHGLVNFGARFYDPELGRFLSIDPRGFRESSPESFNRYAFANNNPYRYTDPDGRVVETAWDVANIGIGAHSLANNVVAGNWGAAAIDSLGVGLDSLAAAVPFVPGGASTAIQAQRAVDAAVSATTRTDIVAKKADGFVDLASPQRRKHILDGDATGGGHRPGTGKPGKSEFPQGWSDSKIMHEISDVATDPNSVTRAGRGGRTITKGTRNGVDIRVIQERNGDIVSGFPTNVPRNPR